MKYLLFLILFFQIQTLKSETNPKSIWIILVSQIWYDTTNPKNAFKEHYLNGIPAKQYKTEEECKAELDNILVSESQRNNDGQAYGRKDKRGSIEIIYGNGGINIYSCYPLRG